MDKNFRIERIVARKIFIKSSLFRALKYRRLFMILKEKIKIN
jgi:hypothetical protein